MTIRSKLTTILLGITLIPILLVGFLSYYTAENIISRLTLEEFNTIASLQKARINEVINFNKNELRRTVKLKFLLEALEQYYKTNRSSQARLELESILNQIQDIQHAFEALSILDEKGTIIASTNKNLLGKDFSKQKEYINGKTGDFILFSPGAMVHFCLPLLSNGKTLGVMLASCDESEPITKIVTDYSGLGNSGESFLVKNDGHGNAIFLMPRKFEKDPRTKNKIHKSEIRVPAVQAAIFKKEITMNNAIDYRDVPILAATRYISAINCGLIIKMDKDEALIPVRNLTILIVLIVLLTFFIAITSAYFLARSVSDPIANLQKGAQVISTGDLNYKINSNTKDEIGQLSRAFDEMAEGLKSKTTTIDNLNREIAAREKAENKLKATAWDLQERTKDLETSNKELEAFSYSVSHDLRAPLRGIQGFSQILLEDYSNKLDNKGKNTLKRVCNATQHMGQLIDDILNLSRITRTKIILTTVDLSSQAKEIAEDLKHINPNRNVEFIIEPDIKVKGDEHLLRILMENLLNNAWKFTSKKQISEIRFGIEHDGKEKIYFVKDNGAGFNMEYADKLFEAFQRLHTSEEFEGSGIGLTIVERIVQRHKGQIWARSKLNEGATFYFTLKEP